MNNTLAADADEVAVRCAIADLVDRHDATTMSAESWRGAQFDAGLAWVWFPVGCGGLGAAPELQQLVDDELRRAGAGSIDETTSIGLAMAAPTLVAHGSSAQQQRHLRPIFTGEQLWCQLFSEPGAGSDLAGLATAATRDGDEWVVNGQKVWTSFAHLADYALCLVRDDPTVAKHRGLTYLIVDMRDPRVEVRALREMTGDAQFSEVFLTDVRVPDENRVGDVGDGWRAAMSTLMNERAGMGDQLPGADAVRDALAIWARHPHGQPVQRDRLVALWIRSEAYRLLALRAQQQRPSGQPGPEGSIVKLAYAELAQEVYAFCMDLLGADGMLVADNYPLRRIERGEQLLAGRDVSWMFLRTRGFTIEGGTSEIQRNVLAERVLGLPAEGRADRDIPWRDIPRS